MKAIFSRIALLSMLASSTTFGAPPVPGGENPSGHRLMQSAIQRITAYQTIEAKLRVHTDVMGQPLVGSGGYAQLRATSGLLLRMELTIQAGGKASSVKQICNGPNLWEHWRIGNKEKLHHIDLSRVEQELAKNAVGPGLTNLSANLIRGGLPKLLLQLAQNFDFDAINVRRTTISRVPTWVVTGSWRRASLVELAPDAVQDGELRLSALPAHLPHQVELHLGEADLFPYRITYQRLQDPADAQSMAAVVTTEFYEVALDRPLDPAQFNYQQPNNIRVADRTDTFLESLGVAAKPPPTKR